MVCILVLLYAILVRLFMVRSGVTCVGESTGQPTGSSMLFVGLPLRQPHSCLFCSVASAVASSVFKYDLHQNVLFLFISPWPPKHCLHSARGSLGAAAASGHGAKSCSFRPWPSLHRFARSPPAQKRGPSQSPWALAPAQSERTGI